MTFVKPPLPQATWQLSMRDMQARDAEMLRAVADWLGKRDVAGVDVGALAEELRKAAEQ